MVVDEVKIQRMLNAGSDPPEDFALDDEEPEDTPGETSVVCPDTLRLGRIASAAANRSNPVELSPAECARWVEDFIVDYCRRNPYYEPPEKSNHPAVIMVGLSRYAIREFGDPAAFWLLMAHALQHWFAPGEDSFEYRVIRGYFECHCGLAEDSDAAEGMSRAREIITEWQATAWPQ